MRGNGLILLRCPKIELGGNFAAHRGGVFSAFGGRVFPEPSGDGTAHVVYCLLLFD